jgi:GT2 family glycosyltransferase/2-polyprenyl-3-methyl-5-hydroxy-6-metoxy-1,4-benzoquinol methylase
VSWNTAELLDRCLAALPAALDGADASVVVVDNASTDSSAEVARQHPSVDVVVNDHNRGYARAMNQAIGGADAEVLIALNPDTEPAPGSLAGLAGRLLEQPGVGLVTPRLTNPDGTLQHSAFTFPSPLQAAAVSFLPLSWQKGRVGTHFWLEGSAPHDQPCDIEWALGAVHVIRARAVDPVTPYSERWFMYVEDLDLCWRLAQAGWRLRLEPEFTVTHVGGASAEQAWGDSHFRRWMPSSYDWYAESHGEAAMRWWAAITTVGTATQAAAYGTAALLGRQQHRGHAMAMARLLPTHARAVIRRPDLPPDPEKDEARHNRASLGHLSDRLPSGGHAPPSAGRARAMTTGERSDLAAEVAKYRWYHTFDLGGGVVTPGVFDHRASVDRYMIPANLSGLRCLDVGTMDGFWAFEMERRGADEVVAVDLDDPNRLDWPASLRDVTQKDMDETKEARFNLIKSAKGSKVERVLRSVYELDTDIGTFDLVFCGDLLVHLKDPVTAVEHLHRVCQGSTIICTPIKRFPFSRGRPIAELDGIDEFQWWVFSEAGMERMIRAAGYKQVEVGPSFEMPATGGGPWKGLRGIMRGYV